MKIVPGLAAALAIGLVAWGAGHLLPVLGGPVVAVLLGLLVGSIAGQRPVLKPGLTFCSKKVLQGSIVVFGATMSLGRVAEVGGRGLPVTLGTLVVALIAGWLLVKALRVEPQAGRLVTYGTAICGTSAIAAMSVVIGSDAAAIALAITVIVVYNVLGAVLFPLIGHALNLSQESFGIWAGTAVNDTSSVVAAATVYGAAATSVAIVVKLTRTLALIPIALGESWLRRRRSAEGRQTRWYKLVPPFLLLFLLAAGINSLGLVPQAAQPVLTTIAYLGTTTAMAAVGMSSSFGALRSAGWRPVALGGLLWLAVASSSLGLQWATGLL